ncbi:MAG: DNA polymerase III subunit delta [Lachnospiraceae bacterium]|jgi:DNA polymerase-3 subunit delta|nr:DNA polymerase III subunit delta [Lachnospiraceae bacterium]
MTDLKTLNTKLNNGEFSQVYVIYGEADYIKLQYKNRIISLIGDKKDEMNYSYFEGNTISLDEVISIASTLPFFAEKRLVVVENSDIFAKGNQEDIDNLITFFESIPDTTYMVFIEKKLDKTKRLYKLLNGNKINFSNDIVEIKVPDQRQVEAWVGSLIKKENKKIEESAFRYLISQVGTDMETLSNELEKIFAYTYGEDIILISHINDIISANLEIKIFNLVDAVSAGNKNLAIKLYEELLGLKETPMGVLFQLTRKYKQLLEIKGLKSDKASNDEISSLTKVPKFFVGKYINLANKIKKIDLIKILDEALSLEYSVKSGYLDDKLSVELFIVKYAR